MYIEPLNIIIILGTLLGVIVFQFYREFKTIKGHKDRIKWLTINSVADQKHTSVFVKSLIAHQSKLALVKGTLREGLKILETDNKSTKEERK